MVMPGGVAGHDLTQQLLARKPGLKVIYTSGYSAEELLAAIRAALDGRA